MELEIARPADGGNPVGFVEVMGFERNPGEGTVSSENPGFNLDPPIAWRQDVASTVVPAYDLSISGDGNSELSEKLMADAVISLYAVGRPQDLVHLCSVIAGMYCLQLELHLTALRLGIWRA
ncbi:hypothetical protein HFO65_29180 [Rhizobium laguerreae]|uniref:hypothetical protein n=1 Tax=Rhizobium laguerreae TaxID=1076926 RepID=UPI001441555C|nr:hypothetical protein [Rhizobium laguerreae]MBY3141836.1 hypothetical protein [Rhizobium laguerreae]MBY3164675.1 hypothetical protein [Rhizobium laguerreae]MBY3205162.1 hypothetical protein [Rhizobium laguerreae]MBY3266690.1 hypothetical protein [Rhizobium laguerreae]MBY3341943.1 hypothetical protein [Rhizobium laguerreae]